MAATLQQEEAIFTGYFEAVSSFIQFQKETG